MPNTVQFDNSRPATLVEPRPARNHLPDREDMRNVPRGGSVWIDLENSPNVPFFKPIVDELQRRGYSVLITARECFQVCGLAQLLQLDCRPIGHHYGRKGLFKLLGLGIRTSQLLPFALRAKPALAISHGSRSQLLAATLLGIPTLQIIDYEHTKAWVIIRPRWVMAPALIPSDSIHSDPKRILRYPGIKEDVYVPAFVPSTDTRAQLGLCASEVLVTMRPPADEAHYHRPETDQLFRAAVDYLASLETTRIVMMPRNPRQALALRNRWPGLYAAKKVIVLDQVVDGLNLIWHSDLVVSAGGTMNREAAALGVPVYSVFRGSIGAVDRYLASTGRLVLIQSSDEFETRLSVRRRDRSPVPAFDKRAALSTIVDSIAELLR